MTIIRCLTDHYPVSFVLVGLLWPYGVNAQTATADALPAAATILRPMTVEAPLPAPALSGTTDIDDRLGLSRAHTPATIDSVDAGDMEREGLRTATEAVRQLPGVTAGNIPGSPASLAMRGFARTNIAYLFDGERAVDSQLIARDFDTFNFDSIQILKGPESVINGAGGLAGTINFVTRKPTLDGNSAHALLNVGSFDTQRYGIGGNRVINDRLAVRADLSHARSDGFVHDTDSRTTQLSTGALFKPTDRLSLSAAFDYFRDHYATPYNGAPLVPRSAAADPANIVHSRAGLVIDAAERDTNYNPRGALMKSQSEWLRTRVAYQLADRWTLVNEASYYHADRYWGYSGDYLYDADSQRLDRTTSEIAHAHHFLTDRAYARFDGDIGAHRNRFTLGASYRYSRLTTPRRTGGTAPAVDPHHPNRGWFDTTDSAAHYASRLDYHSHVDSAALFVEDAFNLTARLIAVGGLRYEHMHLARRIDDLNADTQTDFGRDFDPVSWRLGAVYTIARHNELYAQYNHAVAPITTLLLSSSQSARYDLSTGDAVEIGLRSHFWGDRATLTTALYQIKQDNILTRDPKDPQTRIQGGQQNARGVELDLGVDLLPQWRIDGNLAVLHSEYARLIDAQGNDLSGHTPVNVPERVGNLSSYYTLSHLPLTLGANVQYAGRFYTDEANTIRLDGHTTLGASISTPVAGGTLTLRGRNLTNALYGQWSGYSATQIYLGAPRSIDLSWTGNF